VFVRSGYRTRWYNALIGGDPNSSHLYGMAADIDVGFGDREIPARTVAMMAEASGCKQIGLYIYADGTSWIHIGSGVNRNLWFQTAPGKVTKPLTFIPTLRRQFIVYTNRYETLVAQTILRRRGFYSAPLDGKFGPKMFLAVLAFQRREGLVVDGIVGPATWNRLFN
jgi:hypothetical protein